PTGALTTAKVLTAPLGVTLLIVPPKKFATYMLPWWSKSSKIGPFRPPAEAKVRTWPTGLMRWIELSPTVVTYNWPRAPAWLLAWAGALKPVHGAAAPAPELCGRNRAADWMMSARGSGCALPMDPAPSGKVVPPERGTPADERAGGLS